VSYRDELDAWRRTREATKRIMAELNRDERGYPLPKEDEK
jgi:hypothetical protein